MKIRIIFKSITLLLALVSTPVSADQWSGPDIVATQKEYSKHDPEMNSKGIIYMGKRGTYMNIADGMGAMIIASNNRKKVCWMANKKMKIYTLARMNIKTGNCDAMSPGMPAVEAVEEYGSLMSDKPCEGYENKRKLGVSKVGGRKAQQWACKSSRGHQSMQWYDAEYKIVTKSIEYESTLELTDIKEKTMPSDILQVPSGYKKVSSEEFGRALMADAMSNNFNQQQMHKKPTLDDEKAFLEKIREFMPDKK